jgi:two-component system, NarL family, response regulator DegU
VRKRILLVDDHRLVREGLRRTLEDAGFDVVGEAENGADGLELAERLRPNVVLMDVSMPVMDGITATKRMRSRAPEARVVVLTMHSDTDLVDRARAAGAAGYLLKDASGEEVVRGVQRALEGQRVISAGIGAAPEPAVPAEAGDDAPQLTEREAQILQLLADGFAPAAVAEKLYISPKTVRNHLSKIYEKLGVNSRSQAIVTALQHGLIDLPA